jgi:hypothetical protein
MYPVEPPPERVDVELGRRRHRRLTGPSGLLLFLAMFLPFAKGCDDPRPMYPFEVPLFVPPYLFGLVFAGAAATGTVRGMRTAIGVLRAMTVGAFAASALIFITNPLLGVAAVLASALMLAAIDSKGYAERRAAGGAILLGACGTLWFGLSATASEALAGVYVALAASLGLVAGGMVWLVEASAVPPIVLPGAVARTRRPGLSSGA